MFLYYAHAAHLDIMLAARDLFVQNNSCLLPDSYIWRWRRWLLDNMWGVAAVAADFNCNQIYQVQVKLPYLTLLWHVWHRWIFWRRTRDNFQECLFKQNQIFFKGSRAMSRLVRSDSARFLCLWQPKYEFWAKPWHISKTNQAAFVLKPYQCISKLWQEGNTTLQKL